jgi:hypothetical protein
MREWHALCHSGHCSKASSILARSDLLQNQDPSMLEDHSPQGWSLLSVPRKARVNSLNLWTKRSSSDRGPGRDLTSFENVDINILSALGDKRQHYSVVSQGE